MTLLQKKLCYYCEKISKFESSYPTREGNFTTDDIAFRCALHSQFQCSCCKKFHHFSWLYWCQKEKKLTCGDCNPPTLKPIGFWSSTYTYSFHCPNCVDDHYDLSYSEYKGTHPWQNKMDSFTETILKQASDDEIWIPNEFRKGDHILLEEALKTPNYVSPIRKSIGTVKFHSPLLNHEKITQLQVQHQWEQTSEYWLKFIDDTSQEDKGDINRQLIIDPAMWKLLGDVRGLKVIDAGCGNGYFCRELARKGAEVTGIDQSRTLIRYCKEKELQQKLGIEYYAENLETISDFLDNDYDLIVSNIVFVDVLKYRQVFKVLASLLKPLGRFVWSNLHPIFGRINNVFYRIPFDTPRNEERLYVMIDRYFDSGGTLLSWGNMEPIWQFERTLSEYTTALKEADFVIREIIEPKPSNDMIKMNPRHLAFDSDRIPFFIIFDCMKY